MLPECPEDHGSIIPKSGGAGNIWKTNAAPVQYIWVDASIQELIILVRLRTIYFSFKIMET